MPEAIIRKTTTDAALEIARSLPEFFTDLGLEKLKQDLRSHELTGACVDEKPVGFIALRQADVAAIEVSWLAVLDEYQGQGIGSQLLRESLGEAAKNGYAVCYLKTLAETVRDEGYEKTRSFYKKHGFQNLEIIDPYPSWGAGNPCQLLAAALPLR
jgi:ribosomal protein S18 acetylase RimI-like enzyme